MDIRDVKKGQNLILHYLDDFMVLGCDEVFLGLSHLTNVSFDPVQKSNLVGMWLPTTFVPDFVPERGSKVQSYYNHK